MARPCTICKGKWKDRRESVDSGLKAGAPIGGIAADTGVPETTVRRHAETCVPKAVALAVGAVGLSDLISGAGIAGEVVGLYGQVGEILAEAKTAKDLPTALAGIGKALDCLTLLGKLTGKLRPDTQVNVLVTSQEWLALRGRIVKALAAHPEARRDVLEAMSGE